MGDRAPLEPRDLASILLVVVTWGVNFVVMKVGLHSLTPFQLGAGGYLFAFLPLAFFTGPPRVPARWLLAFGLAQGVVLGERVAPLQWAGAALVLCALACVVSGALRPARRRGTGPRDR